MLSIYGGVPLQVSLNELACKFRCMGNDVKQRLQKLFDSADQRMKVIFVDDGGIDGIKNVFLRVWKIYCYVLKVRCVFVKCFT